MNVKPAFLQGVSAWSPGFPNLEALQNHLRDESATKPDVSFIDSRARRATSLLTRMTVSCLHTALLDAELSLDAAHVVVGSAHGEIDIAVIQMGMMLDEGGRVSPARFKNSVHNTAAGLFSIAAKNKLPATAIAAGEHTFAMCLMEAIALLSSEQAEHVVVCVGDEPLPAPLEDYTHHSPLTVAMLLGREERSSRPSPPIHLPVPTRETDEDLSVSHERTRAFLGGCAEPALRYLLTTNDAKTGPFALSSGWKLP